MTICNSLAKEIFGARAFQMLPNSESLLLDETEPLVWLAVTDGAGYKTVTPFKIEAYSPKVINVEDKDGKENKFECLIR